MRTHPRLGGNPNLRQVGDGWEDVHVAERVYGEDWEVALSLSQMVERVGKLESVGNKEVDVGSLGQQLAGGHLCEFFDGLYRKRIIISC